MTNYNDELGVPYGIIDARDCQYLMEEIFTNGESLNWKAFREQAIGQIESTLDDLGIRESREAAENVFDELEWDHVEFEEEEYEYEDDHGNQFLLSYLGGAPLIWFIKSDRCELCRQCSPCVPGAGDLNNPSDEGTPALTFPTGYDDCDEREDKGEYLNISAIAQ